MLKSLKFFKNVPFYSFSGQKANRKTKIELFNEIQIGYDWAVLVFKVSSKFKFLFENQKS